MIQGQLLFDYKIDVLLEQSSYKQKHSRKISFFNTK